MVRDITAALVALADKHGMTPKGVSRHADLLADVDLAPGDITKAVLLDATTRAQEETEALLRRGRRYQEELELAHYKAWGVEPPAKAEEQQEQASTAVKVRKPRTVGKVVRGQIFGLAATAILRWMGANGWNAEDAGVCLATYGLGAMSDSTIYIQLRAGKVGDATRGPVPTLTKAQAKELERNSK
jgi:hypothetical protein